VTAGDEGEHLLCYGGSTGARTAGAADGPGFCRAHGAGTAAWSARFEAPLGRVSVRRRGPRAVHDLGRRGRREGARGTAAEGRPAPAGDAWRVGTRRRGALAPDLKSVAEPAFQIEFLQKF
jgi:hypothetical protein